MKCIAAISTAPAPGGIGIVRISGDDAFLIADKIFVSVSGKKAQDMKGYTAAFGRVQDKDGNKVDDAVLLVFRGTKSYTGENTAEISCHGGLFLTRKILKLAIEAGAAPAAAGEFTKRAFLNGKMDLTGAEAVMQLISANGEQALKAAVAGSDGMLTKRIEEIKDKLIEIAAHLTAWADFPEEDVPEVTDTELLSGLEECRVNLEKLVSEFSKGKIMREGIPTVIAGRANAGKSTLMNLLSGYERSIVTMYEGTTRDIVEESIRIGDVILNVADTAGIRETDDPVEKIGVEAAKKRVETSQLVLAVFDSSKPLEKGDIEFINSLKGSPAVAVINKTDLESRIDTGLIESSFSHTVYISAKNRTGIDELENSIKEITEIESLDPSAGMIFTERQRAEAVSALSGIEEALGALKMGITLDAITVCIEGALDALYNLTGEKASEDIIDNVFSTFCVGK